MRFTAVESVDGVSTIDEARAGEEHVGIRSGRDSPQEPRHHGRCVCAKNRRGRHVPRVARIPRGGVGWIAKSIVVVLERDDGRMSVDDHGTAPAVAKRGDGAPHDKLHGVRSRGDISQVPNVERTTIAVGIQMAVCHRILSGLGGTGRAPPGWRVDWDTPGVRVREIPRAWEARAKGRCRCYADVNDGSRTGPGSY